MGSARDQTRVGSKPARALISGLSLALIMFLKEFKRVYWKSLYLLIYYYARDQLMASDIHVKCSEFCP